MATFRLFFQSVRAKDLSAPLYTVTVSTSEFQRKKIDSSILAAVSAGYCTVDRLLHIIVFFFYVKVKFPCSPHEGDEGSRCLPTLILTLGTIWW